MQSGSKEIYKMTAERTGKPELLYKDIGNFIFQELGIRIKHPTSLITKIKGLGYFFLRKQRMERKLSYMVSEYEEGATPPVFTDEFTQEKYEQKKKFYQNFKERLVEYNQYVEEKNKINELKVLYKASKRKNSGKESSKADS